MRLFHGWSLFIAIGVLLLCTATPSPSWSADHSAAGRWVNRNLPTRTITVDGRERSYLYFVPREVDRTQPTSVILAFHGGGFSAQSMVEGTDLLEGAGHQHGFIIVYPQGYKNSWNAGPGNWGPAVNEGIDDVAFVSALLDDLASFVTVDPQAIYATGMSNGSAMAYRLACQLSDRVAAVAGVASSPSLPTCRPLRPVPIIHFWGTADSMHRPGAPGQAKQAAWTIEIWTQLNGCTDEKQVIYKRGTAVCVSHSHCRDNAEVVLCTIEGMGHRWPGMVRRDGLERRLEARFGPGTTDLSATAMIVNFFLVHPMP